MHNADFGNRRKVPQTCSSRVCNIGVNRQGFSTGRLRIYFVKRLGMTTENRVFQRFGKPCVQLFSVLFLGDFSKTKRHRKRLRKAVGTEQGEDRCGISQTQPPSIFGTKQEIATECSAVWCGKCGILYEKVRKFAKENAALSYRICGSFRGASPFLSCCFGRPEAKETVFSTDKPRCFGTFCFETGKEKRGKMPQNASVNPLEGQQDHVKNFEGQKVIPSKKGMIFKPFFSLSVQSFIVTCHSPRTWVWYRKRQTSDFRGRQKERMHGKLRCFPTAETENGAAETENAVENTRR